MARDVWFGVHVPPEGKDFDEMKSICKRVEKSGFELFTITDHFLNMQDPNGPSNHPLECWTTLAGLAAVTSKIKLAPLVTCYKYRRPTVLAKMATTVDIISNGRLILGIGAGNAGRNEAEFKTFFNGFPSNKERLRGLRETAEICKKMFAGQRTTYHGKLYRVDNVLNSPQPVQKPIPIMIGGRGEKVTLRIAARDADISHFHTSSLHEVDTLISALKGHCIDVGRNYDEIRKGTSISLLLGDTMAEAEEKLRKRAKSSDQPIGALKDRLGAGFGTPKSVAQNLEGYVDRGIGLITFMFQDLNDIEICSKEILSRF
jgi:alkanesulfonate monooxygenase SsuD/methylene tetrahydromethanopterin reductase-like flavin-dependent oxidoreductase (luciferase family)